MSDSVCAEGCVFAHPETQPELLLCQWCVCGEEVLFCAKQLLFYPSILRVSWGRFAVWVLRAEDSARWLASIARSG